MNEWRRREGRGETETRSTMLEMGEHNHLTTRQSHRTVVCYKETLIGSMTICLQSFNTSATPSPILARSPGAPPGLNGSVL